MTGTAIAVSTRLVTEADRPIVAALTQTASGAVAPERGGAMLLARDLHGVDLTSYVDRPDTLLLLGCIDDVPVALAAVDPPGADGVAMLQSIYVLPDARSVGVGESLMTEVIAWCHERGATALEGRALPGDRATKNFFETHGLVSRVLIVQRQL